MSDKLQLVVEVRLRRPQFDNRQAKQPLAKLSFSPSFSLGLRKGPIVRNRFNGLRVLSPSNPTPKFWSRSNSFADCQTVETVAGN